MESNPASVRFGQKRSSTFRRDLIMWRILALGMASALAVAGGPAAAQEPPGKEEGRKIEAELQRLRAQIQDLENRLKQTMGEPGDQERKGPDGPSFGKKKDGPPFGGGFGGGAAPGGPGFGGRF